MLRLPQKMPEPAWLGDIASSDAADDRPYLLPGVRVRFAPIGPKAARNGREKVQIVLAGDPEDVDGAHDAMAAELLRHGIIEWEGVGGPTGDEQLPVSPDHIELFLADAGAFLAATDVYVYPFLLRDAEGNASAGSPNGTGAAATPADATASSSAVPTSSAAAAPKGKGKKPAPTDSTSA